VGRNTFPLRPVVHLSLDKNSSRQDSGEAIGSGIFSVIVPDHLLSSMFAPFSFCGRAGDHEPALQNFHVSEMAM
jgi:hypothetical protein